MSLPDLLETDDTDLLAYTEGGEDPVLDQKALFLFRAACEVVRDYCGWHIAPSVTDSYGNLVIGQQGLIMLPSMYVTAVSSVQVPNAQAPDSPLTLTTDEYNWFKNGYIELFGSAHLHFGYRQGDPVATVGMTHGYTTCPLPVKSVVFEMMETAMESASPTVDSVQSQNYHIAWGSFRGVTITPDQASRLTNYHIIGIK